ncbi:RNA-dependent RNA polymerase [Erysiphe necator associated narnavirus 47]|nr:RNA-dependent RNA polymerase [Erysiphe necator associated narnavirus 47]
MKFKNYSALASGYAYSRIEECKLYYDRRLERNVVPEPLEPYVRGVHNLYLKQVPSCMTLKKAGGPLSRAVEPYLMEDGFLFPSLDSHGDREDTILESAFQDDVSSEGSFDSEDDVPGVSATDNRDIYEDPFRILAGYCFASQYCEDKPVINVWPGGCHRIQGKIKPDLVGSDRKNVTWFTQINDHDEKMHLLFRHTHWGHRIQVARHAGKGEDPLRNFANTLFRRISFFLRGKHDPLWTGDEAKRFADYSANRNRTYRAQRLLEVLKTVDGIFLQRFLSFPEEVWDWEKFDVFTIQGISVLLTDEFFDGELTDFSLDEQVTHYEDLKRARKAFKQVIHLDEPCRGISAMNDTPRWVSSFLRAVWDRAVKFNGFPRLYLAGTLSQTRGSGTPPPLVVLRSKRKFLMSVSEPPPEFTRTESALVAAALDDVIGGIPDHIFTGLDTKARVTVTGSACWEATRKEGGTAQAILDLMSKFDEMPIPIRDMDTGKILKFSSKENFESIGTAVFHACLDEVLHTDVEDLRKVSLTVVREPSKARVVTKGHAALKIVLDTVSKICSYPLKKGFKSSESGMGKSHHGWNLFKDFSSEEMYELLFSEDRSRREEDIFNDHVDRVIRWQDTWFCSTDYQEATDRLIHALARLIARKWMRKCGIPQILQGIVMGICFQPRKVYFTATGPLATIGRPAEGDTRVITLYRGVLMGDPLTKVILHFSNIISRRLGETLASGEIFARFLNGYEANAAFNTAVLNAQKP